MLRASMYMRASMRASISASGRLRGSDIKCVSSGNVWNCVSTILRVSVGLGGVSSELSACLQNYQRVYRTGGVTVQSSDRMADIYDISYISVDVRRRISVGTVLEYNVSGGRMSF